MRNVDQVGCWRSSIKRRLHGDGEGIKPNADKKGGFSKSGRPHYTRTCRQWALAAYSSPHQQQGKLDRRNWHQLYHGTSRQSWDISAPTLGTALASHLPTDGTRLVHVHDSN